MPNQDRETGTVATWIDNAAFGFIKPDDGSVDRFVHITALSGGLSGLSVGQAVSYVSQVDPRTGKMRAVAVEVIDE